MHDALLLDFETRSKCPIKTEGLARYARHESTQALCAAYGLLAEAAPKLWLPCQSVPNFSDYIVYGWNVAFEKAIWEHVLHWPAPAGWYDIAAHARYCGIPGALANASTWFGLGDKGKDAEGHKIMLQLSQPIKTGKRKGEWDTDAAKYERMYEYCKQDWFAEKDIFYRLPPWPDCEREAWEITAEQNERGCPIDLELCRAVVSLTDQFLDRAKTTIFDATGGKIVSPTQAVALKTWLNEKGINVDNVGKETIANLLAANNLDTDIKRVLEARQIGAPASVKKFKTALLKEVDGRLHHNFYYAGAGATARWSGTSDDSSSVQLQNLFRGDQSDAMLDIIKMADADVLAAISDKPIRELQNSTRSMLCAYPGDTFLYTDLSAIEARVLRWLAKSPALNDFRIYDNGGPDPYKAEAAKTFGKPIDKITSDDRQCGKVLVLSAQYGCGWVKFKATVSSWTGGKVIITDAFAELTIKKFRQANPEITKYWSQLEKAFRMVLTGESEIVRVGVVSFSQPYKGVVAIKLPGGRSMYYNRCSILAKDTKMGEKLVKRGSIVYTKHDGIIVNGYGAHLAENVTQAVSRDIIRDAMRNCKAAGLLISHHAHDSLLIETKNENMDAKAALLSKITTTPPIWASDLPLASPVKIVQRMP